MGPSFINPKKQGGRVWSLKVEFLTGQCTQQVFPRLQLQHNVQLDFFLFQVPGFLEHMIVGIFISPRHEKNTSWGSVLGPPKNMPVQHQTSGGRTGCLEEGNSPYFRRMFPKTIPFKLHHAFTPDPRGLPTQALKKFAESYKWWSLLARKQ